MSTTLILPLPPSDLKPGIHEKADPATQERLVEWLDATVNSISAACVEPVTVDLPDSTENAVEFGYAGSGENKSAFPKARVVALAECGTHAFVAADD